MKRVIEFLNGNTVAVVATSLGDKPRASAVEYVMANDAMIFGTDADSIKANNLKGNNRISLSVHDMPKFVAIDGTTVEPTPEEVAEYGKVLFERHPEFKAMMEQGMMKPFTFFKIAMETAYYSDYSNGMVPPEIMTVK